jgi:hypothetical protein
MRILLSVSLFFVLLTLAPQISHAQQVVQCGVPESPTLETNPDYTYCDIYQRKLAYIKESDKLGELLAERQRNYHAIRQQAFEQYQRDLEALHNSRSDSQ